MKRCYKMGEILLPKKIKTESWGVVACDQYTSQAQYWEDLKASVGDSPSALNLIFPECYLSSDNSKRIDNIIKNMQSYLSSGIFEDIDGTILVERTCSGRTRKGIMLNISLDDYDFDPKKKSLIRATEGVILDRIPPRKQIRQNCPLELPHIMLLVDDKDNLIQKACDKSEKKLVYNGELNGNGGHISGYNIKDTSLIEKALDEIRQQNNARYGEDIMFLVGDGNHSLATAKACISDNPLSKYALVEVVNIYDEGLIFNPIHRVLFDIDHDKFINEFTHFMKGDSKSTIIDKDKNITFNCPSDEIEFIFKAQQFIDSYLSSNSGRVDYVHDEGAVRQVCLDSNGVGILMYGIDKSTLFSYVINNGLLPRKSFSMGEANEKRYYIEARKIK